MQKNHTQLLLTRHAGSRIGVQDRLWSGIQYCRWILAFARMTILRYLFAGLIWPVVVGSITEALSVLPGGPVSGIYYERIQVMFKAAFRHTPSGGEEALWFIIQGGRLLVKKNSRPAAIPQTRHFLKGLPEFVHIQFLGHLDGRPCFAAGPPEDFEPGETLEFRGLKTLFGQIDENCLWVAGRANQLVRWSRHHSYCGKCGRATMDKEDERAKICTACDLVNYPRVSPAIIVAVIKADRILLARSGRFPGGFFSVLAGFVEPGETLEECVKREVFEETGIDVKNIRYFGSQPWPFPDSLMVAFTAEYAGGEIQIDGKEIIEAAWYAKGSLPDIPPGISIARRLIDWFADTACPK